MKQLALVKGWKRPFTCKYYILFVLILGLVLFSEAGYSQRVTLTELIGKTKCTDFSCYNDFITSKGFCYQNTHQDNFATSYSFSSCNHVSGGPKGLMIKDQSLLTLMSSGSVTVDIGTSSISYHQKLLLELSKMGFKAYEIDDSKDDLVFVYYKSKIYPKIITSVLTKLLEKNGSSWTYWNFSMRRVR